MQLLKVNCFIPVPIGLVKKIKSDLIHSVLEPAVLKKVTAVKD